MIIHKHRVSRQGSSLEGEEPPSILDLDEDREIVRFTGPVTYRLHVEVVSGELVVRGQVSVSADLACSRCAVFFSTTLTDSSFLRAYDVPEGVESVDVTGDLREAILLQLPDFPICSAACKGLCPQCGKDLNRGPCDCEPAEGDARWSALDGLRPEE